MADMSPENLQKLIESRVRVQTAAAASAQGVGGLSAGDKMKLMSGFEQIVNRVLMGSAKMGGSTGLLQQFDDLIADYGTSVKEEMTNLFKRLFKKQDDIEKKEDEPVQIDSEQYKKLHKDSLMDVYDSKIMKKLSVDRVKEMTKFLKNRFMNSLLNNKLFKRTIDSIVNLASSIKTRVIGLVNQIVPGLLRFKDMFVTFAKSMQTFVTNVGSFIAKTGKILVSLVKGIGMLMHRMALMTWTIILAVAKVAFAIISFLFTSTMSIISSIVGFLLFTVVPMIVSGFMAIIGFLTPILATVGVILLKALLVVAVVFLVLFALWKAWKWLNETFPKAMQAVKDFFKGLWNTAKELWSDFTTWATDFWEDLSVAAEEAWRLAGVAWDWLYENIGFVVSWVGEILNDTWNWLKSVPVVGKVFTWIETTFIDLAKNLHKLFFGDGPFIQRLVNFILDTKLIQDLAAMGQWIMGTLSTGWTWLVEKLTAAFNWWSNTLQKGWDEFMSSFDTLYGWIEAVYDYTVGKIADGIEAVSDGVGVAVDAVVAVGNTLNPLNWFAKGGVVTKPTMAMIGERVGTSEAVIPLNSQGISFLAAALQKSNILNSQSQSAPLDNKVVKYLTDSLDKMDSFNMKLAEVVKSMMDYFNALGDINVKTYNQTSQIKSGMEMMYQFATGQILEYSNVATDLSSNVATWFAEGGIVRTEMIAGIGEDGPEMVIPLNDSGAEFVRSILSEEMYTESGSSTQHMMMDKVDKKLDKVVKMVKSGDRATSRLSGNRTNTNSSYVDYIARGIIE